MTKPNYTHIHMLFDRSGSMSGREADVNGWYKTFIAEQKKLSGECTITAEQFDDESIDETIAWTGVQNAPAEFKLVPRGMTPLRDAVAKAIVKLGLRLSEMREEDRPSKVIVIVQTDGQENSSREYTLEALKELVKLQRETYSWEFIFLGANIDSFGTAGAMGIGANTTSNFGQNSKGYAMSSVLTANAVSRYRSAPTGARLGFLEEEQVALESTVEKK